MKVPHPLARHGERTPAERRRVVVLTCVVTVQVLACVFFVADVLTDFRRIGVNAHTNYEAVVALALLLGTGFGVHEIRRTLRRNREAERALSIASGAFSEVVEGRFTDWGLTAAESEVALFVLKGLQTSEIAALRGSAEGTVRAQLARIYAKSGSQNRAQFVSQFVEDLLAEPVVGTAQ
ncbi:helix-turn-helix transcriptional regulator [Tropicimonas isoalkanivorans]|uniref:Regulatory protein, luxR family n=1 Tax=Tropicimonas isoalkanivorans TaxID=441112 RepID=A0A1I1NWS0_9RHOB|nr:helix-turn-helix transcriptional regulator [Tropicimonas isoalkanivorans]SFD02114.1 regulatory protein, luxR family [Tropicimonas isoalkanivorans]